MWKYTFMHQMENATYAVIEAVCDDTHITEYVKTVRMKNRMLYSQ